MKFVTALDDKENPLPGADVSSFRARYSEGTHADMSQVNALTEKVKLAGAKAERTVRTHKVAELKSDKWKADWDAQRTREEEVKKILSWFKGDDVNVDAKDGFQAEVMRPSVSLPIVLAL